MPTHRSLRMAEAIREVVATTILFDVADPRVRAVTVLRVEAEPTHLEVAPNDYEGAEMKYRFGRAMERRLGVT